MATTRLPGQLIRSGSIPPAALGGGVISASAQLATSLPTGTVSSSGQFPGWITASSQVNYNTIQNKLSGVVSASAQITPLLPGGTVSSSAQVSTPSAYTQSIFDSSGTWTKPATGNMILVECWGGGGGGSNHSSDDLIRNGGGGGGYNYRLIPVSSVSSSVTVTVGAGGVSRTTEAAGDPGGNSSFGSYITGYGGAGPLGTYQINIVCGGTTRRNGVVDSTLTSFNIDKTDFYDSLYRGGSSTAANQSQNSSLQNAIYGGGGGRSYSGGPGSSSFGGNGGDTATDGSVPGGGGGRGNGTGAGQRSGAGGAGRVIVTVW